jgi:hypothetical protein
LNGASGGLKPATVDERHALLDAALPHRHLLSKPPLSVPEPDDGVSVEIE